MLTRRQLLQSVPIAASLPAALAARQLQSIGAELYTVRDILPKQPAETLGAIKSMGYREIEPSYDGLDRIWSQVAASGLTPVAVHLVNTMMNAGQEATLERALEQSKKWGFRFVVFPYVPVTERGGLDKFRELCDKLNRAGEKAKAAGLRFCYHNHAFEFAPLEGSTGFQVMIDRLDKNLCGFEMDCFWVSVAGNDPAAMLKKLSGRVPLVHLKDKATGTPKRFDESVDRGAFKEIGNGSIDWPAVLRAASAAGVEHYFVEQDQTTGDPLASLRQSYTYLAKLQF
jgi:sugar phosphate isomerase/epimerase